MISFQVTINKMEKNKTGQRDGAWRRAGGCVSFGKGTCKASSEYNVASFHARDWEIHTLSRRNSKYKGPEADGRKRGERDAYSSRMEGTIPRRKEAGHVVLGRLGFRLDLSRCWVRSSVTAEWCAVWKGSQQCGPTPPWLALPTVGPLSRSHRALRFSNSSLSFLCQLFSNHGNVAVSGCLFLLSSSDCMFISVYDYYLIEVDCYSPTLLEISICQKIHSACHFLQDK